MWLYGFYETVCAYERKWRCACERETGERDRVCVCVCVRETEGERETAAVCVCMQKKDCVVDCVCVTVLSAVSQSESTDSFELSRISNQGIWQSTKTVS